MVDWKEHIVSDPTILLGKPCIKGTRISVEFILKLWASEWTEEMIVENYPGITRIQLAAVAAYIYGLVQDGLLFELKAKAA